MKNVASKGNLALVIMYVQPDPAYSFLTFITCTISNIQSATVSV